LAPAESWTMAVSTIDPAAELPQAQPQLQPRKREVSVALWPVVIVLYATLLPREMRLSVGELTIYADRAGLILVLPYIIRKIMEGAIRFVLPDFLILFLGLWMIASMIYHLGFGQGLQRGGALALDATVAYYLARISFRSLNDMRRVLVLFAPGLFLAASTVMAESVLRRDLVQPLAEQIFGKLPFFLGGDVAGYRDTQNYFRLGLMRASGPFSHSILGGLYLASMIGLYNLSGLRGWPRLLGNAAGLMSFFSLSSAAILATALSYGLIIYERLQQRIRELSWTLLLSSAGVVIVLVEVTTNIGFTGFVTRYLTLNQSTAFFRTLIWEFGSKSVMNNPLFGIGFESYERPDWMLTESVDAHWLLMAMRFGLPAVIALVLAVVVALVALSRASVLVSRVDQSFYRGIAISLFVLSLMMFTVTLWGGVLNWFNLLLGGCVACAQRSFR
jgi:hypothetical protein